MKIKSILLQNRPPQYKGALWIKPEKDGGMSLWVYNARKWQAVGGAGGGHDVIIKHAYDSESSSYKYTLEKGDLQSTIDKITAGEYVDVLIYTAGEGLEGLHGIDTAFVTSLSTYGSSVNIEFTTSNGPGVTLVWDMLGIHAEVIDDGFH